MGETKKRYLLIDGLRGIAIISMVVFHFLYDINEVFGADTEWYENVYVHFWQQSICCSFIIISGFVWKMGSRWSLRRGVYLNIWGFAISAVTAVLVPAHAVWFGILNFMGCSLWIMGAFHKLAKKVSSILGAALSLFAFVACRNITEGTIEIQNLFVIELPDWLYEIQILTPLGFPYRGFASSDYFPVLPWFFLFLLGYYAHSLFAGSDRLESLGRIRIPILSVIGQKSIGIYLVHQPVCMVLSAVIIKLLPFYNYVSTNGFCIF